MKRGVKLFNDRDYVIDEMPDAVRDLPFFRTSIEQTEVEVTKPGTLFALTPTIRPGAASQEETLRKAGFAKVEVPETQLFPGEINRVSLYRKEVKSGERLKFKKMVLLVLADDAAVSKPGLNKPVVISNPGASFQDEARSGAMIIGMDRTPRYRIWGCWTGTGDKKDGYRVNMFVPFSVSASLESPAAGSLAYRPVRVHRHHLDRLGRKYKTINLPPSLALVSRFSVDREVRA